MTAVEVYRGHPDALAAWWPRGNPAGTLEPAAYVVRRHPALVPNPANPVHAYYPHVAATLGVRVVVQAAWTARVEVA